MKTQENTPYETLKLRDQPGVLFIVLSRTSGKNSLNSILVSELRAALAEAEMDMTIKVVVLEGNTTHFCTGMDFQAVSQGVNDLMSDDPNSYYELLKEISGGTKVVISKVEGQVNAGGVGLVAASDLVISSTGATFGLSEMLFGLLPACVLPFLICRIGFQKARWMTLITQGISAQRALEIGLVDEVGDDPSDLLRRNILRLTRLETETIGNLKEYMSKLWIMDDKTRDLAVERTATLVQSERVQKNIKKFISTGTFPWSK